MNYWIFKANPDKYRIDDRLKDKDPVLTWRITRYTDKVKKDDLAFIWRTGQNRGICAVIKVTSNPMETEEINNERMYTIDLDTGPVLRVYGNLIYRGPFISHKILKQVRGLNNLSVFHGFQMATNFEVTPDEGRILMSFFGAGG